MGKERKSAFTLIELLIVVAIIAILAAIAVPNFLEAQVRAKVSRVKADSRSLAIAFESYRVDNTEYPPGANQLLVNNNPPAVPPAGVMTNAETKYGWIYHFLTSPIAYMSAIPRDPFTIATGALGKNGQYNTGFSSYYDYSPTSPWQVGAPHINANRPITIARQIGVGWWLRSFGPSRNVVDAQFGVGWVIGGILGVISTNSWGYPNCFYDPSNGTVSRGHIIYTNRGVEPAISSSNQHGL